MYASDAIEIRRDVQVLTIPEGLTESLPQGEVVTLYQALGGSYTVVTERGTMVRVAGMDADAIGKEVTRIENFKSGEDRASIEHNCWEFMRTVYDPEIPVNIVELGLVYECQVSPPENTGHHVAIVMTLTAAGCGMGPVLQSDVELGIKSLPGVASVTVEVVFDEPQYAITPGQATVFYRDDEVVGGAWIERGIATAQSRDDLAEVL